MLFLPVVDDVLCGLRCHAAVFTAASQQEGATFNSQPLVFYTQTSLLLSVYISYFKLKADLIEQISFSN